MTTRSLTPLTALSLLALSSAANGYPGGTPQFQTDVAPFCASCHSSLEESVLEGAGDLARKNMADKKHLALILAGEKGYAELSATERETLAKHVRATDDNSSIVLSAPAQVPAGEVFQVTVELSGGAGPVVGVALVDRAHRWYARPAASAAWTIASPPTLIGPDGHPQNDWLNRRPESAGRSISFVNVTGIESNAAKGTWAKAKVIFSLRAPERAGIYPLTGAYFYGTEKASPLGYKVDSLGRKLVRGGTAGGSGRIRFTNTYRISVK